MTTRCFTRGGKTTPSASEIMMTTPMIVVLLLFSALPFVISLFSIENPSLTEMFDICRDEATRITLEVSLLYALISILFSVNISMRMAYRMYFSCGILKTLMFSVLFMTWIIPSFIAIPLYRSVMYWFADNLIDSGVMAFLITVSAKIWINIPLMTLIAFAAISQIPGTQVEMMMTEGASKESIYNFLFKPSTKAGIGMFALMLFINSMRDLNIPIMMTNGRPYIAEGFTPFGIAGYTTTFGLFLKDSLLRINTDFITYTQSLFATLIMLILFLCVIGIKKTDYRPLFLCLLLDLFFYPSVPSILMTIVFIVFYLFLGKLKVLGYRKVIILMIPIILNGLFILKMTPGLMVALVLLFFHSPSDKTASELSHTFNAHLSRLWNMIGDGFIIVWLFLTGAVFFNLFKLMFSDPLYIPEWNEFDPFTLNNFYRLFSNDFMINIMNSILIGVSAAVIIMLIVFPAAYTTTIRKKFNRGINLLIIFSLAITGMNTIIPLFIMFSHFRLTDTFTAVVLTVVNHSIPLAYFIITEDLQKITPSYLDTAKLEGASHLQIFSRIILPLIVPIASVIALKVIVDGFSSFTAPLMFISSPEKFPISLRLFAYAGKDSLVYPEWGLFAAGSALSILILFLLIFPFRRFLMRGIYRSWADD
ncbi:MAG TPA: ABC transporter permease subunit [Thermotogota bacterium]|nr:ABC transporter permease subunit [Thermotogota bacterium]HPR96035.1 ABC transporter permease subunit [Thermotogota bacterium]